MYRQVHVRPADEHEDNQEGDQEGLYAATYILAHNTVGSSWKTMDRTRAISQSSFITARLNQSGI